MSLNPYPIALTIAGSDSGGGAGIQADLKTFLDFGVFGMSALTAITAQNTLGVFRVDPIPVEGLIAQLEAVFSDFSIDVVKLGMLASAPHAKAVAQFLKALPSCPPVVFDPVMVATTGARLLDENAVTILREEILPLCAIATPNLPEAKILAGNAQNTMEILLWAAAQSVPILVTGGDAEGEEVRDLLIQGKKQRIWTGKRIPGQFHGTGCTLASAIAAGLAKKKNLEEVVGDAIFYVQHLVALSAKATLKGPVGHGVQVLPHGKLWES